MPREASSWGKCTRFRREDRGDKAPAFNSLAPPPKKPAPVRKRRRPRSDVTPEEAALGPRERRLSAKASRAIGTRHQVTREASGFIVGDKIWVTDIGTDVGGNVVLQVCGTIAAQRDLGRKGWVYPEEIGAKMKSQGRPHGPKRRPWLRTPEHEAMGPGELIGFRSVVVKEPGTANAARSILWDLVGTGHQFTILKDR